MIINRIKPEIKNIKVYQPGKPNDSNLKKVKTRNCVKLASNENPLGSSNKVLKAIKSVKNINIYPDGNASILKNKLSEFYQISEDSFIIGNGSEELIDMAVQILVEPGDEVIFADPSFIKYELAVRKFQGICIKVPLDKDYKHDLSEIKQSISDKTRVIFICNPNNPTGTVVGSSELKKFISKISEEILVVVDEAYYEYMDNDPNILKLIKNYQNLIILRTFSKIYGLAGLRIGYAIAKPQLITMINRVRNPFNVNAVAQIAAVAALEDTSHRKKSIESNIKGKQYLIEKLDELNIKYIPTQANFIMIYVGDSQKVFNHMLVNGLIIRPGETIGMPKWIRVTIGKLKDNIKFINLLKIIMEVK